MQKPERGIHRRFVPRRSRSSKEVPAAARVSIIATTTEIMIICACWYAHIGNRMPGHGRAIVSQSTSDIVDKILALPPKQSDALAPVVRRQKGEFRM